MIETNDNDKQRKELIKIHQLFGHVIADKLRALGEIRGKRLRAI